MAAVGISSLQAERPTVGLGSGSTRLHQLKTRDIQLTGPEEIGNQGMENSRNLKSKKTKDLNKILFTKVKAEMKSTNLVKLLHEARYLK